jgi:hypothetical protein
MIERPPRRLSRPVPDLVSVPAPCMVCGAPSELRRARVELCGDCAYASRPHLAGDPYDDLGESE